MLAASLASCQKPLVYEEPEPPKSPLTVRFDWSGAPEAEPAEMSLMAFVGTSQPVQLQFEGREGGNIWLPAGEFDFIGYNSDTEMAVSGEMWGGFEIYSQETQLNAFSRMFATTRIVPKTKGTEEQPVIYEPDSLWTSVADGVVINEHTYGQTLTMAMEGATHRYVFEIGEVENLKYVNELTATISGMSGGWKPVDHRCTDTQAIIPFTMDKVDDTTIRGAVDTFGHCPQAETHYYEHKLVLYTEMVDGSKFYYTFDVTGQMHDADHLSQDGTGNTDTPIVIKGLPLPKPLINGSGLQPEVTEWNEVDIGIDL